jgi:hypothetical protein
MISLVLAATVVLYMDRQALAVVAPVLEHQFHMSNVAYSRVVFAFMQAYTLSNAFSGAFLDRVGTRIGYGAGGCVSPQPSRFRLGFGEYGIGIWRNDLQPRNRVGGRPLLLHAGILRIRTAAADRRHNCLDSPSQCPETS